MQWIKWTMAVAMGWVPAAVLAGEPGKPGNAPQERQLQVEVLPSGGPINVGPRVVFFEVDAGEGPRPGAPANPQPQVQPQPQQLEQLQNAQRALLLALNNVRREKGSYLGVSASAPPAVLRKQLGLTPGMCLVVDFVVPDSPAAKAGLQRFDILQKLDDQLLINQQQLAVLVRSHKAGDEVKLTLVRDGKPTVLAVKLIEHDVEPLAEGEWELPFQQVLPEPRVHPAVQWPVVSLPLVNVTGSMTWIEGNHSFTVTTDREGHKTFAVKGKDGKAIFEGPINTKEDRDKIPAELKEKLQKIEQTMPGVIINNSQRPNPTTQPQR